MTQIIPTPNTDVIKLEDVGENIYDNSRINEKLRNKESVCKKSKKILELERQMHNSNKKLMQITLDGHEITEKWPLCWHLSHRVCHSFHANRFCLLITPGVFLK